LPHWTSSSRSASPAAAAAAAAADADADAADAADADAAAASGARCAPFAGASGRLDAPAQPSSVHRCSAGTAAAAAASV
jgi:hypothetical protein